MGDVDACHTNATTSVVTTEKKMPLYKGDAAVIGMMPSRLRLKGGGSKKKKQYTTSTSNHKHVVVVENKDDVVGNNNNIPSSSSTSSPTLVMNTNDKETNSIKNNNNSSVMDDYETFMAEISSLKWYLMNKEWETFIYKK